MKNHALVGLTVDTFKGIQPAFFLRQIRMMGVDFAEATVAIFEDLPQVTRVAQHLKMGLHLPIIPHEGFDFSCVDHRESIHRLIRKINAHWKKLGLQYALSHPPEGHLYDSPGNTSEEFLFENLRRLECPVVLENTIEREAGEFEAFLSRAKEALGDRLAGICFDGPHAYISRRDWFEMFLALYPEIRVLHLSDCTKEKDLHQPFGLDGGEFPVERVLEVLRARRFWGIVNLELMPQSLSDLSPLLSSYLLMLRYLHPRKYLTMRLKSLVFLPLLHRRVG